MGSKKQKRICWKKCQIKCLTPAAAPDVHSRRLNFNYIVVPVLLVCSFFLAFLFSLFFSFSSSLSLSSFNLKTHSSA